MSALRIVLCIACAFIATNLCAQMQEGWSDLLIAVATEACTQGIVAPAKKEFAARVERSGDTKAIFPEEELRQSSEAMCTCIVQRAANDMAVGGVASQSSSLLHVVAPRGYGWRSVQARRPSWRSCRSCKKARSSQVNSVSTRNHSVNADGPLTFVRWAP